MVEALLKAKININARNKLGQTALHLAAHSNAGGTDVTSEVESVLIDNGADLYAKDQLGRIPLHYVFVQMGQ